MITSKTLGILKAVIEISSNRIELLPLLPFPIEVKSLLTDFLSVIELPECEPDGRILVLESSSHPSCSLEARQWIFRGPFLDLEQQASDLRFSLWGNQGFLYRYALSLLETEYGIYSLHACGLFDESRRRLYVFTGGGGSGKTVYLLSGLARKLKLFSTETVHFRLDGDKLTWFMGSLIDNVRFGTLIEDFPAFRPQIPSPPKNKIWQKKIALDLSPFRAREEELSNVGVTLIFPRIEAGRDGFQRHPITDTRKVIQLLFNNISEKIAQTIVLYDRLPIPGLDNGHSAARRLKTIKSLISHPNLCSVSSVLSNPHDNWGDILNS